MELNLKAHAKINLSIDVVGQRDDGYHNLKNIMIPLEFHDNIFLKINNKDDDFVICDDFNLQGGRYNVCHKIINLAREKWGFKEHFDVSIHKNIFIKAGLGGGSADAAQVLLGVVKLLKIDTNIEELKELAINAGSDIPFSLYDKPCLVEGKGEIVTPIEGFSKHNVLLIKPESGLDTEKVFKYADENGFGEGKDINKVIEDYKNNDFDSLNDSMFNVFEKPAISMLPVIGDIKAMLKDLGFKAVLMSGSGSTLYVISDDLKALVIARKILERNNLETELTRTL